MEVSERGVLRCREVHFVTKKCLVIYSLYPYYIVSQIRFLHLHSLIFHDRTDFPNKSLLFFIHKLMYVGNALSQGLGEIHTLFSTEVAHDRSGAKAPSGS